MSAKEVLLEVAEKLPSDATLADAIYELEFRQAVEDGLASVERGERIPVEEARKRLPRCSSKSSSPATTPEWHEAAVLDGLRDERSVLTGEELDGIRLLSCGPRDAK
jgi:predicted transcriptional regulator